MLREMVNLYAENEVIHAQLKTLEVTAEEWDTGRGGGHFWFDVSGPAADSDFVVDALADDLDGVVIDIILHSENGLLNWGEWYRVDGSEPVLQWPPSSLRPHTPAIRSNL